MSELSSPFRALSVKDMNRTGDEEPDGVRSSDRQVANHGNNSMQGPPSDSCEVAMTVNSDLGDRSTCSVITTSDIRNDGVRSDEEGDDAVEEDEGSLPSTPARGGTSLLAPSIAPQLGSLHLPSPVFGRSFVDLLVSPTSSTSSPVNTSVPPIPSIPSQYLDRVASPTPSNPSGRASRSNTLTGRSSRANLRSPRSSHAPPLPAVPSSISSSSSAELGLVFSKPRPTKDERIRDPFKISSNDDHVFTAMFPDHGLELRGDVEEWDDRIWTKVGDFLAERGYRIDANDKTIATRLSDSFPLSLEIIPTDSDQLDIIETLSTPGARTNAARVTPLVPVVGIVPLNDEWTAILSESWKPLPQKIEKAEVKDFLLGVVGALSHLHTSHHISHLNLSCPNAILVHPHHRQYSLTAFTHSFQADPFLALKKKPILFPSGDLPEDHSDLPEKDKNKIDPFKVDAWDLNKVIKSVVGQDERLRELTEGLGRMDPKDRWTMKMAKEWVIKNFFG